MSAIQQSAVTQVTSPGNSNYDPYYSNVSLSLAMNGSNNSTSFVDASPNQKTVTANGDAKISTAQFKFGGSSAIFDGSGDYLRSTGINNDYTFGTGDFTVEFWVNFSVVQDSGFVSGTSPADLDFAYVSGTLRLGRINVAWDSTFNWITPVVGTWYHIAYSRSGSTLRVFVNGVGLTPAATNAINYVASAINIGFSRPESGDRPLNGYIDDLRITKGIARYTSNFTVPAYANPLTGPQYDPFYNNVSLLLHCNGSNASTNFIDNSGIPKTMTVNGNAQISTAQWKFGGSSAYFDGNGDWLSTPNSTDLNLVGVDFTIEAWIYYTQLNTGNMQIVNKDGNASFYPSYSMSISSTGKLNGLVANSTGTSVINLLTSTATVTANTWNHVAFTRSGSTLRIFINGTIDQTFTQNITMVDSGRALGIGWQTGYVNGDTFYGYMDDFRITKGIARYTTNFTPPRLAFADSGPNFDPYYDQVTLLLPFNGANASTSFIDNSKTANIISVTGNTQISTAQSKFGGSSVFFDGNGDWLSLPSTNINFQGSDFTIEFWIYRTSNALGTAFSMARDQSGTGFGPVRLDFTTSLTVRPLIGNNTNTGWQSTATGTATIPLNTWGHYALVRSGAEIKQYINGVLDLTITGIGGAFTNVTRDVTIGYNNTADLQYLTGYLDDFRITKGVARYTSNFTVPVRPNPTTGIQYDNYYDNVSLLLHMNGPNNGTSFVDNSLRAKTVTANGNAVTSTTQYRYGVSSAYFDGSGDSLTVTASNEFDFGTDPWTIECWVRIVADAGGVIDVIIGNRPTGFSGGQWYLCYVSSQIVFDFRVSGENNQVGATGISFDTWYHIAVVRNGTNYAMYKDGVLAQSLTISSSAPVGSNAFNISIGNSTDNSFPLNGYIDDLRITKGIARYTANFTPPTQALPDQGPQTDPFYYNTSLLLHFDGTNASTNFVDNSPVIKSVTPSGNAQISTAQSKFGGSSVFLDGTGDYLQLPFNNDWSFGTGDFTIEMWFYIAANSSLNGDNLRVATLLSSHATSGSTPFGYAFNISGNGSTTGTGISFNALNNTTWTTANFSYSLSQLTWYHIAVSKSSGTIRIFVDGVSQTLTTNNLTSSITTSDPLRIGTNLYPSYDNYLNGYIDDLRITKGVARYVNNFTPPQRPFPDQ